MGAKEGKIINDRLANLSDNERMFRANAGLAWGGIKIKYNGINIKKGTDVILNPYRIKLMPDGFPDMFGWKTVEITEDMVGQKIAIFVGEEVKATGGLNKDQRAFGKLLSAMGGIWRVVRGG